MTNTIDNQKNDVDKLIDCPMNILEFQKMFPDETACIKYLERMRWSDGFVAVNVLKLANRRFYRAVSFRSLLELGALTPGVTYKDVYGNQMPKLITNLTLGDNRIGRKYRT